MKHTGKFLAIFILLLFFFVSLRYWLVLEDTAKVGRESPDFLLKDLEGNDVQLSDYFGNRLIVVFWATWCDSCKDLLTVLEDIEGWDILAINLAEDSQVVKEFASEQISFKVLLDKKGRVADRYNVSGVPETFIIDKEGVLRARIPGNIPREQLIKILKEYTP